MSRPDPERVWLGFAQAAIGGVMSINVEIDPHATTWEQMSERLADDVAAMADLMLERWKLRYEEPPATVPARLPKPGDPAVEW